MVDKINPIGQAQNLPQSKKFVNVQKQEESKSNTATDDVVISKEALSLSQVENTAKQAYGQIASDKTSVLSNDENRLNALI